MSNAFQFRMPAGIPGSVNRSATATVEAQILDATNYPTTGGASDPIGSATTPTAGIGNVLKRGYMTVQLNAGTAAKNGAVYVRTVANGGNTIIGGIEAAADSTNVFVMANAYFTGPADASGNVEIAFNL